MKVYLIEKDNCESYEDFYKWISSAHSSYRGASQSLIDEGFEAYIELYAGKYDVRFYWQESNQYMAESRGAKIIEMELQD